MAKKRKSVAKEESKPKPKIQKSLLSSSDDDDEESESEEESDEGVEEVEEEEEENESSESSEEEEEEEENEDSKLENIKELLEPFSKEQLLIILKEAFQSSPAITAGIVSVAESDPVHRKIFVHSLGWDCTNETLIAAFKPFGVIEECNVITDKTTGRSKGYGFVLFQNRTAARKALKQPQKKIGNRFAACQLASTRPVQNQNENQNQYQQQQGSDVGARKLYVANVGPQIRPEKLRAFFAKFGEIEDGPLGFDKVTGKFRGFAIIIYRTLDGIKKALEEPFKVFDGVKLQCSIGRSAKNNNNAATGQTPGGQTPVGTGANAMVMPGLALGLNPGPIFLGQNPAALGVLNPMLGVGAGPYAGGVSQPVNSVGNAAIPGFGVQPGISSISPNVMGGYGSQAAPLQGLGAYTSYQFGQPSSSATGAAARPQTGTGPYFGR